MNDIFLKSKLLEAQELGLKSITIDGITYEFRDQATSHKGPAEEVEEATVKALTRSPLDDYTEDEILMWSSPYFDVMQEQKQLRTQQIKDKEDLNG